MLSSIRDGQYQILHKLGAGGMGEVYQARDTRLNRLVAVKVLSPEQTRNRELQRRFIQEAQAASALNHPNIVTIYDIATEGGADMLIMEYVAGKTLDDLIPKGGLRVPQVISCAVQIASALAAAHSAGIVHRDLKPGNVMVTDSGLVKILDFGLAKLLVTGTGHPDETVPQNALTMEGSIVGTVAYMSPEQAQGKKVDARSDIFSFGAVLYEMATGDRAFHGGDTVTTLTAVLRDEVRPIAQVAPDVPHELEALINRCLRKDPADRYQSMREIEQELISLKRNSDSGVLYRSRMTLADIPQAAAAAAPATAPANRPPEPAQPKQRKRIFALPLLAVVGIGGWWVISHRPAPTETKPPAAVDSRKTLHADDVVEMLQQKVAMPIIVSQIRSSKRKFDLSADEVIDLSKAGASKELIEFMRDPDHAPEPQDKPAPSGSAAAKPVPPPAPPSSGPAASAVPTPPKKTEPAGKTVILRDGIPVQLELTGTIPDDAQEGTPLKFTVTHDVTVDGSTVIARGAAAAGAIHALGGKRRLSLTRSKMTYRMETVQAVDGKQLRIRATSAPGKGGEPSNRPLPPNSTGYLGYIDGEVAITGR